MRTKDRLKLTENQIRCRCKSCKSLRDLGFCDKNSFLLYLKLHANYSYPNETDEYLTHRISQAFELSQFISQTGASADVCVMLGDLNLASDELGFKLLKSNAGLVDAFTEAQVRNFGMNLCLNELGTPRLRQRSVGNNSN
jgi:hypothetical protein